VDDAPIDGTTWWVDADGDGWGDPERLIGRMCGIPVEGVSKGRDCDDSDPCIHPGAGEPCDGVDNDCNDEVDEDCEWCSISYEYDRDDDGLSQCDDPDCACSEGCGEVCDDGVDDDGDGLVDCEDGECADDEACIELACEDGLDSDNDGLVDCEDDDCWDLRCHPAGVKARVTGGTMVQRVVREYETRHDAIGGSLPVNRREWTATLSGVSGTVQVLPSGSTFWGDGGARSTCTWTVGRAYIRNIQRQVSTRWFWHPMETSRWDVELTDGCRISPDAFLPNMLHIATGVVHADNEWTGRVSQKVWTQGDSWYAGELLDHRSSTWSSFGGSPGPYAHNNWWSVQWSRTTNSVQLNGSGETYWAQP